MNKFQDILGKPYSKEFDCLWAATRALERILPGFVADDLRPEMWQKISATVFAPVLAGDVVLWKRDDGHLSIAAVVAPDMGITSTPQRGSCMVPLRVLTDIDGVYRKRRIPCVL